jgi:phage terminase large subunit GpA-like protein
VRANQTRLPALRAIKGSSEEHKPVLGPSSSQEVNWRGQKWPNGVKLWSVGVDTAKDLLLGQLAIEQPGPGYVHFSRELPREWFEQLTAEQRILAKHNGRDTYKWVKRRPRNEVLDCRNYALHAAFGLGLHNHTDRRWQQIEQAVQPPADLFNTPEPITLTQSLTGQIVRKPVEPMPATTRKHTPRHDEGWSFDRRD